MLFTPGAGVIRTANLTRFTQGLAVVGSEGWGYEELHAWSVASSDAFWSAIWDHAGLGERRGEVVCADRTMPGARWFSDEVLNYAERALARTGAQTAVRARDESGDTHDVSRDALRDEVRRAAAGLRRIGVHEGDRVAAYLPNRIQAIIAFLATASLGAVWTACAPEFGVASTLDRFEQVEPKVLIAATGYTFNGARHDRSEIVATLSASLPTVVATVIVDGDARDGTLTWTDLVAPTSDELTFTPVPFDHPLWIVYTSGTTGVPKAIVHSHGGIVLEHVKLLSLHLDLDDEDTFFWFTTTGWVMWNIAVGGLLVGATIVVYDGSPTHPDDARLWDVAAETGTTFLGLSAGFIHNALRADVEPHTGRDITAVAAVGVTGSPLSPAGFAWLYRAIRHDLAVASISGGTDVATAFLGSSPTLPVKAGRLQAACLGVAAACYDDDGRAVVGQVGELVITQPMPSMPVRFWGDPDGHRYRDTYFDMYPGQWRHGDWVEQHADGSWVVYGRSDATLNRGGVRMGTSDFYSVLDRMPAIQDSLIVDTTAAGSPSGELVLLVVPSSATAPHEDLVGALGAALRTQLSPRHVPDAVLAVAALPHTLNGKRLEVPVRRLFLGHAITAAVDPSAVDDIVALESLAALARKWRADRRESEAG